MWSFLCKHKFLSGDIELTGIAPLDKPKTNDYDEWMVYFRDIYTHESHTKRVKCSCSKCGKVVYAHCGLDILKFN